MDPFFSAVLTFSLLSFLPLPLRAVGLTQRFLVLQLFVPSGVNRPLLLELGVSDTDRTRRRLLLSTAFREPVRNPLHAQVT